MKNSWLSKEIFFYSLFFISTATYFFIFNNDILVYIALFSSLGLLISIDKVYSIVTQSTPLNLHSAYIVLTGFLFASLLFNNYIMFLLIALLKATLYTYRKYYFWKKGKDIRLFIIGLRLDMLISFPLIFYFFNFTNYSVWILVSVLLGEFIDRAEYYEELDVITPKKQIKSDFLNHKNN